MLNNNINIGKHNARRDYSLASVEKASKLFIRASMTVEAAVVLPLFMVFFINLSCSIEMIRLHSNLQVALWNIGNDLTMYGALTTENMRNLEKTGHKQDESDSLEDSNRENSNKEDSTELTVKEENAGTTIIQELGDLVISYTYIKNRIIDYLGSEYLNNSPLSNGTDSLQFYESDIFTENDNVVIITTYQVKPLIDLGGFGTMRMSNFYYAHLWNGYNVCGPQNDSDNNRIVFITEESDVYHTSTSCTYLRLSIRVASYGNLWNERNSDNGMYTPCLLCVRSNPPPYVYVCDEGSRYHYSRNCFALRRRFSAVNLSSVAGTHRPCSRCGG